ncbi:hypothetical protein [Schnuerera sp.]|uniref:hypothetical protein n=1 Tax=Schnuerera sp. TaxID=2794844 RepID=UPI002BC08380|nr:hypothetical protein [Schnuerera sp.]HSH36403.1 hypothetical protein [Schnuerera sp.]
MVEDKGFISIIALFTMSIILISSLFLIYTSNLEYLIVNSSQNNIQAYYLAESKIHIVLNKDEYYYDQLMPKIKKYIRYGRIGGTSNRRIILDNKDLYKEDNNNIVKLNFIEDNRRYLELETYSTYSGIKKNVIVRTTIINDLFEMKVPVLSKRLIHPDKIKKFENYILTLEDSIEIPDSSSDIIGIESMDYEEIRIIKDLDSRTNIEYYRNNMEFPVKEEVLVEEEVFIISRNDNFFPNLIIESENDSDKVTLKGILYIEGDLNIHNDFQFCGILIVNNGEIYIDSSRDVNIEGIVLLNNCCQDFNVDDRININYNLHEIKNYGIYLPNFIEPEVQVIKGQ